jgi:hypothetical protein
MDEKSHLDIHEDHISIYNLQQVNHQLQYCIKYNFKVALSHQEIKHANNQGNMKEKESQRINCPFLPSFITPYCALLISPQLIFIIYFRT